MFPTDYYLITDELFAVFIYILHTRFATMRKYICMHNLQTAVIHNENKYIMLTYMLYEDK